MKKDNDENDMGRFLIWISAFVSVAVLIAYAVQ